MAKKPTMSELFQSGKIILAERGLTLTRKTLGFKVYEFRVNYKGGDEETAYYTDDITDAVQTGLAMAEEPGIIGGR